MELTIPDELLAWAERRGHVRWIADLPALVTRIAEQWSLDVGEPYQPGGQTAWVAPAMSPLFGDVTLKVAKRHYEADDEAKGLREWNGDGAVELLLAEDMNDTTTALLLEPCHPGTPLGRHPEATQDVVISALLRRLWKPPPFTQKFRPLEQMCNQWADSCEGKLAEQASTADSGLIDHGVVLFRSLPATTERTVLLCTDLHAGNVLAAQREPWLVIDPKPYVGDPTYDVLQHLLNCTDRLVADPLALVLRLGDLCDLDTSRLARWLFARCVIESPDRPELLDVARQVRAPAGW